MTDDKMYLQDILDRLSRIEVYTQGGKTEFLQSSLIQDGVIRCFEVIGEAVKLLSPELRQNYSDIPWRRIAGFRDVLIHNYAGIDLDEVWNVVEYNLPDLKPKILGILLEMSNET
ncbi:MAG: DUF86 domain-containing protein [Okeania sp. SIO2C2]|uniref:HepT-like ribonuclease domain-containing protein n=1 Tax=Okeania sp. SIO2C2 TaxID=2607787 RepID=UPI0013B67534|nr:DUF86 domain-containing protein [Okeania sp. SIO2C2]NEP89612.1 DUF86 domain-containing protein [Okeania sp. SIO2C2]